MKALLQQYAAYNAWANQKLTELILTLPEEVHKQQLLSSFATLQSTILHMWDAESIWWQRMKLQEVIIRPSDNFNGRTAEAVQGLLSQNKNWENWLASITEMGLDHVFSYYNTKKELFKQPIYQVVMQVMNHGTYHRGQLVNMLRQLGQQKIPATDYIVWSRKK